MENRSFWTQTSGAPHFPELSEDLRVDVVVAGGGICGITAAYLLKRAGKTVALLDRDSFLGGDTSRTTAHLSWKTDSSIMELVRRFGEEHGRAVLDAGKSAIDCIEDIVRRENIDCSFGRVPAFQHARVDGNREQDAEELRTDAELAVKLGFDAELLESVPLMNVPGYCLPNQAKVHPLRYLVPLLKQIDGNGSAVFARSALEEVSERPLEVRSNGRTISCEAIVIATHVPLQGLANTAGASLFQTKLASYSSYAVGGKLPSGTASEALFWDTAEPYRYLRVDRLPETDSVILGGEDHKTGQSPRGSEEECFARLEQKLRELFPGVRIDTRWSGQVVETADGLPYIGEFAASQFIATGFSGNGMTFGTLGGMMAADWVLGRKNPWSELFRPSRTTVSAAWDYVKENVDYPYYLLKDRLRAAESGTVDELAPGEGRILSIDGKKVAVYRDDLGSVTTLSPVCTHLGCNVHWNAAESTWDCPCHGSRFRATGEVLSGPAEEGLRNVRTPE